MARDGKKHQKRERELRVSRKVKKSAKKAAEASRLKISRYFN
jgi:hypothetical protein